MSNCVLTAFKDHMEYLRVPVRPSVERAYRRMKLESHGTLNVYTYAGVVSYFYDYMTRAMNWARELVELDTFQMNTRYITWKALFEDAEPRMVGYVGGTYWRYRAEEVEKVTVAPAIYCMLNEQHAQFGTSVPNWKGARVIMAFKFRRADEIG